MWDRTLERPKPTQESRIRVLHIEAGGTYGGSVRALESYLLHADHSVFQHDLLLQRSLPGTESLCNLVGSLQILRPPASAMSARPRRRKLGFAGLRRMGLAPLAPWLRQARCFGSVLVDVPDIWRLCRLFRSERYDVIHINNTFPVQAAALVSARLCDIPVVAHVRNPVAPTLFNRLLCGLITCAAAVNSTLATEVRLLHAAPKVETCYDGIDGMTREAAARSSLWKSINERRSLLIGSVGRLEAQKGYQYFIRAAAIVVRRHPRARFVIAGTGSLQETLSEYIRGLGLEHCFSLCGFQSNIPAFVGALDAFVCPSLWEGGPLTVAEALLLGCPVISTDVGFVPELLRGGAESGLVVPKGDADALADAMCRLVESSGKFDGLFTEWRAAVLHSMDPEASARALEVLLKAAVTPAGPDRASSGEPCAIHAKRTVTQGMDRLTI